MTVPIRFVASLRLALIAILLMTLCAAKAPTYEQLQAQIQSAQGGKRAELLAKLAHMDFDLAHQSIDQGNIEKGEQQLGNAKTHAQQAVSLLDAEASQRRHKGIKQVEIEFRKIAFALRELSHEPAGDVPPVQETLKYFLDARDHLLNLMFEGKPK